MYYYQFNIGDYRSATVFLTNEEDLAYRRLLDMYYDTEKKIPLDTAWVGRRIRIDPSIVLNVLNDMFEAHEDGYFHARCDLEIAHFKSKAEQASRAGKASAERRLNGRSTEVQPTNNYKPITNNQQLFDIDADASLPEDELPTCPHKEILQLYKKHLPHLTQPRVWEGNRMTVLKSRWIQASKPSNYSPKGYKTREDGLKWWDSFFAYIANDSSLNNGFKSKDRTWLPDLEWIITASNFAKIIDGKYAK